MSDNPLCPAQSTLCLIDLLFCVIQRWRNTWHPYWDCCAIHHVAPKNYFQSLFLIAVALFFCVSYWPWEVNNFCVIMSVQVTIYTHFPFLNFLCNSTEGLGLFHSFQLQWCCLTDCSCVKIPKCQTQLSIIIFIKHFRGERNQRKVPANSNSQENNWYWNVFIGFHQKKKKKGFRRQRPCYNHMNQDS